MSTRCAATTRAGHACSISALPGSIYCRIHKKNKTSLDALKKEIEGCAYLATKTRTLTIAQRRALPPRHISAEDYAADPDNYLVRFSGRRQAVMLRCNGTSRRSGVRCRREAMKGMTKCRLHGGKSPGGGPRSKGGPARTNPPGMGRGKAKQRRQMQKNAEFKIYARVIREYGL